MNNKKKTKGIMESNLLKGLHGYIQQYTMEYALHLDYNPVLGSQVNL